MDVFAGYGFEIATTVIAVSALISAERAIRIAKHALQLTKETNLLSLRLRMKEVIAYAERSFFNLQTECQKTREQWERHHNSQRPLMSLGMFERPKEIQSIFALERSGSTFLRELIEEAPTQETRDEARLEQFVGIAKARSLQIERLILQLESPRPFSH